MNHPNGTLGDRDCLLLLHLACDIGVRRLKPLLETFESPQRLLEADETELREAARLHPDTASRMSRAREKQRLLFEEHERAAKAGVGIVLWGDADYPPLLETIADPSLAIYIKGSREALLLPSIAIVGTRRASLYGLQCAERLGHDLAVRGFCVASGLAKGIDAAGHRGALRARGATVAVLGSGLCEIYPRENRALADAVERSGAVISEFPLMTRPERYNFPQRNRLISGLSRAVVVVEASDRSGALITADYAAEQGREVFAVPGPMDAPSSSGTHRLIKEGAYLLTSVEDVLSVVVGVDREATGAQADVSSKRGDLESASDGALGLAQREHTEEEKRILAALDPNDPKAIDALIEELGSSPAQLASPLLRLEMRRCIRQLPGKQHVLLQS